jgi:hypothetical protein
VWLLAATSSDPIIQFAQYGILGLILLAILTGYLWPKPPVERLQKDFDRLQAQYDELVATYQREVIPMLARAADALTRRTGTR